MNHDTILTFVNGGQIAVEQYFEDLPKETKNHSSRVAEHVKLLLELAQEGGMFEEEPLPLTGEQIRKAVLYHDVGMAMIPERILLKIGGLTEAERRVIQKHAAYGGKILERYRKGQACPQEDGLWRLAAEVAVSHHERWDGKGYPYGLVATAIPVVARATAIADSFDSIVMGGCYRMPLPPEYALLEIMDNAGTQFDPALADIFRSNAGLFLSTSVEERTV